jgi:hypothetical protein
MKIYKKGNYIYLVNASGDIKQDHANEVKITKTNVSNETYSIYSDDLGVNNVTFSELTQENGSAYASVQAFELWYAENTGFNPASGGSGAGTVINTVSNYAGLPDPTLVSNDFYWVSSTQGYRILGTYKSNGLYYSNGTSWEYIDAPTTATQNEVNTGTLTDKYLTPSTFENASKWVNYLDKATYDIDNDGIVDNAKKEVVQFINKSGATILKGTIVYLKTTSSSTSYPEVLKANSVTESTSSKTIGAVFEDVLTDGIGYIVTSGEVRNIDTSMYNIGDKLWLSTTDGLVTTTMPTQPNHNVFIGTVTRSQTTNGRILYSIQNGYELNELHNVLISDVQNNDLIQYDSATLLWKNKPISSEFIFVNQKTDLPTASGGIITLLANKTYYFTTTVDLIGDRLVGGINSTILGASSENCIIKSTGLSSSTALITSIYSLPIRNITLTHGTALNLDGDGTTTALDWFGVNFTDCATIGTIKDYTNFIMNDSAFLNSQGLTFDGTIGTIGMTNCLFDCRTSGTAFILPSTLTVSRRFRIIYSSFVILSGETGLNVDATATIGNEKYILDTINFSGGGTYQSGLDATSNKSLFANCVGITNTSTRGFIYMNNNTTATGTNNTALWFKALGTTSAMATNSKFTTSVSNRLTYTGAFTQSFMITVNCNVRTSVSTQNVNIGIAKNGTIITESEITILCAAGSTPSFGATQIVVELTTDNYVELFVQNTSSANNVTVSDMNFNCVKIPV